MLTSLCLGVCLDEGNYSLARESPLCAVESRDVPVPQECAGKMGLELSLKA